MPIRLTRPKGTLSESFSGSGQRGPVGATGGTGPQGPAGPGIEEAPIDGTPYSRQDEGWVAAGSSGPGGGAGAFWNPRLPPTTPHAMDDEFDDSSLDGKWTEMDYSDLMTVAEDITGLKLISTSYNELATLTQPVPVSDYMVWTKISIFNSTYDGWGKVGICFQEGTKDNNFFVVGCIVTGGNDHGDMYIHSEYWSDYLTVISDGGVGKYFPMSIWIRVLVDVSEQSYTTELSLDGLSWQKAGVDTPGFTPTKVGAFIVQADGHDTALFSFFRVTDSIDPTQIMRGNK
jgi:hypothetical protein